MIQEDILCLQSVSHLKRLSRVFSFSTGLDMSSLQYIETQIKRLDENEKMVTIIIDEIHTIQRVEYQNGKLFGLNTKGQPTKTVLAVMIKSLRGKYKDVISLTPVLNLNSSMINQVFQAVLPALMNLGLTPVAILADNHTSNRRFYTVELCKGTLQQSISINSSLNQIKLFLLFDMTHNFKNIYNNFMKRKQFVCPKFGSIDIGMPKFEHIVQLYNLELGKPLKIAYKLYEKVLHPTDIEKTNVTLAENFFHESTIAGLKFYGNQGHIEFLQTVPFLELIRKMLNITNCKSKFVGQRKRNDFRKPIITSDDEKD